MTSIRSFRIALLFLIVSKGSYPQQAGLTSTLRGEIHLAGGVHGGNLTVVVESAIGGDIHMHEFVRPDGGFDVHNLPSGPYEVTVMDSAKGLLWRGMVQAFPGSTPLMIELDQVVRARPRAETVSVTRLTQKPSPAAMRELKLAEKASRGNNPSEAVAHLRRAVELAPQMQDARNNLGAKYLQERDYESARRELEAAVALDSDNPVPHVNLALALLALKQTGEAEAHARTALRRDPLSPGANFALGAILERTGRPDGAIRYLEAATEGVPQALLIQARILVTRGETRLAAAKLRDYLSRPGIPQRAEVRDWLNAIEQPTIHLPVTRLKPLGSND
jgi:Flp pilus assembly protein TadD